MPLSVRFQRKTWSSATLLRSNLEIGCQRTLESPMLKGLRYIVIKPTFLVLILFVCFPMSLSLFELLSATLCVLISLSLFFTHTHSLFCFRFSVFLDIKSVCIDGPFEGCLCTVAYRAQVPPEATISNAAFSGKKSYLCRKNVNQHAKFSDDLVFSHLLKK